MTGKNQWRVNQAKGRKAKQGLKADNIGRSVCWTKQWYLIVSREIKYHCFVQPVWKQLRLWRRGDAAAKRLSYQATDHQSPNKRSGEDPSKKHDGGNPILNLFNISKDQPAHRQRRREETPAFGRGRQVYTDPFEDFLELKSYPRGNANIGEEYGCSGKIERYSPLQKYLCKTKIKKPGGIWTRQATTTPIWRATSTESRSGRETTGEARA